MMGKNILLNVYLETTIPSYLTSFPSRDLIIAAHQQITSEWWQTAKERFNLFISEAVLYEIRSGNSQASLKRVELVKDIPILDWERIIMINDSIVEEIRSIRQKIFSECDNDLNKLMQLYKDAEKKETQKVITFEEL